MSNIEMLWSVFWPTLLAVAGAVILVTVLARLPWSRMSVNRADLPYVFAAIVAVAGWYTAHGYASQRDADNKRREIRAQYLIDAYRKIESMSSRPEQIS